jgi:hypothetical protein
VQINLTPPKQIQLHSSATLLVTIFGTQGLPVSDLNLPTVGLGGGGVRQDHSKDVNNDGQPDLVLHFKLSEIVIPANGEVCLEGQTLAGMRFAGCTLLI